MDDALKTSASKRLIASLHQPVALRDTRLNNLLFFAVKLLVTDDDDDDCPGLSLVPERR